MRKVFIVNDSGHDLSDAKRFGAFIIMTEGDIPKYHCTQTFRDFSEIMKDSNERDYILQSGPSTVNSIACCIFAVKHKRLNLLLFTGERYIVRDIIFKEVKKNESDKEND